MEITVILSSSLPLLPLLLPSDIRSRLWPGEGVLLRGGLLSLLWGREGGNKEVDTGTG